MLQRRMEAAHATLEAYDQFRCLSTGNVNLSKFAPILQVHQPASKHHPAVAQWPAPQVGKVNRVKRRAGFPSEVSKLGTRERLGCNCESKFGLGTPREVR